MTDWLDIRRGDAPLVVAFPHAGTKLPEDVEGSFVSGWAARRDTDWWIDRLYGFAAELGATTLRMGISRSVIDVNRDPSGVSLYPGQVTTELCPTTDFDGVPLYVDAPPDTAPHTAPDTGEVAHRRSTWFDPYHAALAAELARLRAAHDTVVLYDAHSIRSRIPRLFDGELPQFNIGTNGGTTCAGALADAVERVCSDSGQSHVRDGRFRGGWTTRHYGQPKTGVHAIQIELAMRGYVAEPDRPTPGNWPPAFDADRAAPLTAVLRDILVACLSFARTGQP